MWTHPAIECLLNELRKRKMLYDHQHADYLNRGKRQSCLEGICKILLEKEELEVTVEDVKSKIQVLRSQLNKELRYIARSKKYKPKLWCFKKLEFLKPFCGIRTSAAYPPTTPNATSTMTNGHQQSRKTPKNSVDQNESMSTSTFEADVPSSSNNLTLKAIENETNYDCDYGDVNQQFLDTITFTQQIIQNRILAKQQKVKSTKSKYNWEGELVKSQLDLITDETVRSDTMWEIQCVLRRGIEQDRVLPKRRRHNRRSSLAASDISAGGSCISLDDSNDSTCKETATLSQDEPNVLVL